VTRSCFERRRKESPDSKNKGRQKRGSRKLSGVRVHLTVSVEKEGTVGGSEVLTSKKKKHRKGAKKKKRDKVTKSAQLDGRVKKRRGGWRVSGGAFNF